MIERWLLRQRIGVHQHEFVPTFDRLPIPEAAGLANPSRPLNDVDCQSLKLGAKAGGSFIIGLGYLRTDRER